MAYTHNELPVGAFSGYAQRILLKRYGDPRSGNWGLKWLINWEIHNDFEWFPAWSLCIHKDFQPLLFNAFKQLECLNLHKEIKTLDEAFGIRHIIGSPIILSVHSWGAAIDLNAEENPMGSSGCWSREFIDVMLQNGVFCGQQWNGRTDPMHFAMING